MARERLIRERALFSPCCRRKNTIRRWFSPEEDFRRRQPWSEMNTGYQELRGADAGGVDGVVVGGA